MSWCEEDIVAFGARKEESSESLDSNVDTDSEDYHVMLDKWLQLKDQNLRWENVAQKQTKLLEELAAVGHKKVECFAREKKINMSKTVNMTFIKSKRVEEVSLAKSGLLDEIKDETSEDGCNSVRRDLEEDQEASTLETEHEIVCGTKGKDIEVRQEVMRDDLQEGDSEFNPRQ
ncbi:hypothetical protein F2Q69_00030517 [Brassica cretica]|uniref:Uncharacterized protein n=1 Tax=Brassica cretica TaxID=69181 RepID=A0A8S9S291_BRACR|nr:hypothetical protein F2Q69_00030517 [Brassica cretica]